MSRRESIPTVVGLLLLTASLVLGTALPAFAVDPNTEVTVEGGGWGHGIGMSQFGAKAMADSGSTAEQILQHFYTGVQFGQVGVEFTSHAEPLHIGVAQNQSLTQFEPVAGEVTVCLDGICQTASPGESWALRADGLGMCQLEKDAVVAGGPSLCSGEITWSAQPGTQVTFPGLNRTYARGRIIFKPLPEQLDPPKPEGYAFHIIVEVPLEEYLLGLGEVPNPWSIEALKAQVIAARTYALYKAYAYRNDLRESCACHLYGSTADQAYRGWYTNSYGDMTEAGPNGDKWVEAVQATAGKGMWHTYHGSHRALEAYYYSSSGGATENNEDAWGGSPYPYLRSVSDPGASSWSKVYTFSDFSTLLGVDEVVSVEIVARYQSGSPSDIAVKGLVGGELLESRYTGGEFKSRLGLRSHYVHSISGLKQADRLAGSDRYGTAVSASQDAFPGGASTVYVGTGLDYPDALSGGVAAAAESAPVLLVTKDVVPAATRDEIKRLAPSKIVVLGGSGVVSDEVVALLGSYVSGVEVQRRAGPTRFETSVEVSKGVFDSSVQTVYVTGGFNFADAMVAGPAAVRDAGPLLLVHPSVIPTAVKHELERLGPERIVVVGGTTAVPDSVLDSLRNYAAEVTRINGANRYAVGAAVASTFSAGVESVYVAVGSDFPDALAGSALSGQSGGPILLVHTDSITDSVKQQLDRLNPSRIVILGGTGVVSEAVADQLAVYID